MTTVHDARCAAEPDRQRTGSVPRLEVPGPRAQAVIARDAAVMSPSLTRPYPFVMAEGRGAWVRDVDGHEYLDFTAGVAVLTTGHCHPRVVAAVQEQATRFLHMAGTDFYYEVQVTLAERLAAIAPVRGRPRVFFGNSGTEAIEGAIKLARYATGRPNLLAFIGGFHGRTLGALSLTASKAVQRDGFGPLLPGVFHAPFPNAARHDTAASLEAIDRLFATVLPPRSLAAIVVEPVQGEGGYVVPPPDFLPALRALCDRTGALLVVDEVQTGMGRTGRLFAIEHWGVEADILCLAKGLASGLPLSAFIAGDHLMTWPPGAHGNTFGGNPLACAAALATLDLLQDGLVENAARVGAYLLARLAPPRPEARGPGGPGLAGGPVVREVRGLGLMIGLECVDAAAQQAVVAEAFARRLLTLPAGATTVRLSPPLVLSEAEAEEGARRLEAAVAAVARARGLANAAHRAVEVSP
jgi:4-aminobutyrate aminotransferase